MYIIGEPRVMMSGSNAWVETKIIESKAMHRGPRPKKTSDSRFTVHALGVSSHDTCLPLHVQTRES